MSDYGEPLYSDFIYCKRCCVPETYEGIKFDEMGICSACQSSEQKMRINWKEREIELRKMFDNAKKNSKGPYDCIIGISGGKDSTYQLHILTKVYGLNPLAVTFSHNWYTEVGKENLMNSLEQFDVDHLMFTPRRGLVNKLAKKSLGEIGDACWHCHSGIGSFVLQTAIRYDIPLIVWGESIAESSGRATYDEPVPYDREYFTKVSAKVTAENMVGDGLTLRDLNAFVVPSQEDCDRIGIKGIYLGDYIFWDDERQVEFIKETYGWKEDDIEGSYKGYKSVECKMTGVHDYAKFIKRGFGKATDHASADVRAGLVTREEGFELAKKFDTKRPDGLDYYLKITGLTEEEFINTLKGKRQGKAKNIK
jgi:N-acetyl sugar amidotransferase